ncbi:non-heme iron oxygenase ferredoxin subunit [Caballeronia sp. SEWSISQ10-4 2]|uniref:non-heme iron oxygenase ferredoxin subunit n=1 Tax=Caballeronia sp. SEWSISQ10-4 2 TaxID=2937438 RepID=UPI0034628205
MQDHVRLCEVTSVKEGSPVAISFPTFPCLAVYQIGREYFVTNNRCTHGNGMLTDGFQDGEIIECPFHGGAFNIKNGAATMPPCQTQLRTYPVEIDDGWISIQRPNSEEEAD